MRAKARSGITHWSGALLGALLFLVTAEGTAEALFPRPAGLEPDIGFWLEIYTRYPSSTGVLHDSADLSIVYGTLALPEGLSRRARGKQVDARKQHYRSILATLARGKREGLTAEERQVLELFPADVANRTLQQAGQRIRFQLGQADRFKAGVIRSGEFKPFIEQTLAERGLPEQLAALPHVESSFEPRAYSKVGAAGLWQFTRSTGRRYMRVDHVVDERRDPFLSTVAAARLLENNYSVTGSWPLAITGYNHGVAGMRRAATQLGTTDIETIVRNYKARTFGFASRNFYVAFLAALQIDAAPEQYFGNVPFAPAARYALVTLEDYVPADGLSAALNIDVRSLQHMNPALQEPVWLGSKYVPRGFTLRLPADRVAGDPARLLANLDADQRFAHQLPDVTHRVRSGETLSAIATEYGLRVSDLVAMNNLPSQHRIRAGQVLNLPTRGQTVPRRAAPEPPAPTLVAVALTPPAPQLTPAAAADVAAEPLSAAELLGDASPTDQSTDMDESVATAQADLAADPSDYSVAPDNSIEIQALETLGHYADWLEIRTQRLRDLNGYNFGRPVVIGDRIALDLSRVDSAGFEARRVAYHRELQEEFFRRYKIQDTRAHTIRRGESVWVLAHRRYGVPVWLLRQFNPDLDLDRTRPGTRVQFPLLEPIEAEMPEQRIASK